MDRARHHFLARAAFAGDQHGSFRGRHHFDQLDDLAHRRALADQLGAGQRFLQVLAQAHHFAPRPLVLQRVRHQVRELVRIHRLGDVIVGPDLQRLHRGFHRSVTGHDDDRQVRVCLPQASLQFHAVHARHLDVEQRNIELRLLDDSSASRAPPAGRAV